MTGIGKAGPSVMSLVPKVMQLIWVWFLEEKCSLLHQ